MTPPDHAKCRPGPREWWRVGGWRTDIECTYRRSTRNLEEKLTLLRKAHPALPDGGALVVYDTVIDDDRRENTFGLLMSLNMLIETQDGFDYTGADCRSWMADVGFRDSYVEHHVGPDSMVVGIK